jgi:hypothetical protein
VHQVREKLCVPVALLTIADGFRGEKSRDLELCFHRKQTANWVNEKKRYMLWRQNDR